MKSHVGPIIAPLMAPTAAAMTREVLLPTPTESALPVASFDVPPLPASVEYLGNKRQLVPFLMNAFQAVAPDADHAVDLFTGTGTVAAAMKSGGLRITANDHLAWCSTTAEAVLLNDSPPPFAGLANVGRRIPYQWVLEKLNALPPKPGFVYRHYSPASAGYGDVERRYFTTTNAARIDAIREQIEEWSGYLTRGEHSLLVSDLLRAAAAVSNVAGTYGCFLKGWKPRALEPILVKPTHFIDGRAAGHRVHRAEAADVIERVSAPMIYADPPYTKRQYAAYYHLLETIALADEPTVSGATGLRPWHSHASAWCYKRRAPQALVHLLDHADCKHFFLSYSEDGQIPHERIVEIMESYGPLEVMGRRRPRYRSSRLPHRGAVVQERLYYVRLDR